MRESLTIGYARLIPGEQPAALDAQADRLGRSWCERVYRAPAGADDVARRRQFGAMLMALRPGDTLVATRLASLAPTLAELLAVVEKLGERGIVLRILDLALDTNAASGQLLLPVLRAVADMERATAAERQRAGIVKAKAAGKFAGRAPTARAKSAEVVKLSAAGMGPAAIARKLKISERSTFRILAEARASTPA